MKLQDPTKYEIDLSASILAKLYWLLSYSLTEVIEDKNLGYAHQIKSKV